MYGSASWVSLDKRRQLFSLLKCRNGKVRLRAKLHTLAYLQDGHFRGGKRGPGHPVICLERR